MDHLLSGVHPSKDGLSGRDHTRKSDLDLSEDYRRGRVKSPLGDHATGFLPRF